MRLLKPLLLVGFLLLSVGGWLVLPASNRNDGGISRAMGQFFTPTPEVTPEIPIRKTTITVPFTSYHWWLVRYSNNNIVCNFAVEHEGLPNAADIEAFCETRVFNEWRSTKPCDLAVAGSVNNCPGFYLHLVGSKPGERPLEIELPIATVWITIDNCNPQYEGGPCTTLPDLVFTAEEPLPNESIISVQGTLGGEPFTCMGPVCKVPLKPTGLDGVFVEFWADSSFGDSSQRYTARARLVPWGDFMNPEQYSSDPNTWFVDVLSRQWRDGRLASCSETWQSFPPIGGPPEWLTSPSGPSELESDISYYYLAGALITYGEVDASGCVDGGLQAPNIASPCGVEAARPHLAQWQNRFDEEIMLASADTGVPARLLKNVFARESQIWPGIYTTYQETGLGQLTENGADAILLWNPHFFSQFCPLILDESVCALGFGNISDPDYGLQKEMAMLRGALVRKVDASCPDCPAGIDLSQANYSVGVFAEGMLANCEQVDRIINNITGLQPGQTSSYEDLWRFTLVNYNAGPGCLSEAIETASFASEPLDWPTISTYLEPACQGAVGYVEDISRILKPTPTPTLWLPFGTLQPTPVMPRVLATATATPNIPRSPTPTITNTPEISPTPTVTLTPTLTATPTQISTPTVTSTIEPLPEITNTPDPSQITRTPINQ